MTTPKTDPIDLGVPVHQTAPRVMIAPTYKDPATGALYVHTDLVKVQEPWAEEEHLSPMDAQERFGDVGSWVAYVERFAGDDISAPKPFLTWNASGLAAVLDYARPGGAAGRCQWLAQYPFVTSAQWQRWMSLADGRSRSQKQAVEALEDFAADIREPAAADLMALLRSLRASINATADTELRADGTYAIAFTEDTKVRGAKGGKVDLPPTFRIAVPVLKGHVDGQGRPVLYAADVRLRVSVEEQAHLTFRFTIPEADRILEDVYADRVKAASDLLGDRFTLFRAAD